MNVLVVLGHPRTDSFGGALAEAYRSGAEAAGVEVRDLALAELEFDPDVHAESPADQALEPDLREAQADIRWADHLVFVYPNWWGTMPALLKGFFDRTLTSGFAFEFYDEGEGAGHEELLSETTAELVVTMDVPPWVYRWIQRRPGHNAVKRATLGFCGIRTTRITNVGPVEDSTAEQRETWLEEVEQLGLSLASGPESRATRAKRRATTWLSALRLQFYPMAWIAYTVGALAAVGSGGLGAAGSADPTGAGSVFTSLSYWLGFGFLFSLEAATVLSNEYVDRETDRHNTFAGPFTGGSRVLVEGELDRLSLLGGVGASLALAAAFASGVVLVGAGSTLATGALIVALGVLALGYTIPPLELSYRTLGELDVAITHTVGVLLCGFVFFGGPWHDPRPWLLSLPFFVSILPAITLAGVPDYAADRAARKETIAVRFGIGGATTVAAVTTVLAALLGVAWHVFDVVPGAYGPLVYLSVPHALVILWLLRDRLAGRETPRRIDGLLAATLAYIVWFGVVPLAGLL